MKRLILVMAVASALFATATSVVAEQVRVLKLATTTSTMNSGLLDFVLPAFEKKYGIKVHVIAVGTGKALKLAENGDVDLVMVHAPGAEKVFTDKGHGVNRRPFMKNDFVIAGPPSDPAGLKKAAALGQALMLLKNNPSAVFISRGDDSGTHKKELNLWGLVSGPPLSPGYLEIGQGMEAALRMADEKGAYTLTDRGTYLALKKNLKLDIAFEGSPDLDNQYSVIAVNPARWPRSNYMDSMLLIAWLTSPEAQTMIGSYRVGGEALFHPTALPGEKK